MINSMEKRSAKEGGIAAAESADCAPSWVTVCQLEELIDNIGVCALLGNRQIAIFKLSGINVLYAIDNFDPFSKANVLSRGVVGDFKNRIVVASPIYKHHFDLVTGECLEDNSVKLQCFAARVSNGAVQIFY
jgi:nitrite reductase (NADH) small subunit